MQEIRTIGDDRAVMFHEFGPADFPEFAAVPEEVTLPEGKERHKAEIRARQAAEQINKARFMSPMPTKIKPKAGTLERAVWDRLTADGVKPKEMVRG